MNKAKISLFSLVVMLFLSSVASAQFSVINAQDVKTWMTGKKQVALIDARPADEYQQAHIPGAINIPADRMKMETARLPKGKTVPIIFYCRGTG
jgi:rhodanese-related sulfurtransferase